MVLASPKLIHSLILHCDGRMEKEVEAEEVVRSLKGINAFLTGLD